MVEDYYIRRRDGRLVPTGTYEINRRGNRKEKTRYQETYLTAAGELLPEEWARRTKEAIAAAGEEDITECVKDYCREKLAWLRTEKQLEEYALDIHAGRVYRHWPDFRMEKKELEFVFFIG